MKFFFLVLSVFLFTCAEASVQIFVTNNIQGEIKPCGCAKDKQFGGMERLSTFLKQNRNHSLWFDLGNYSAEPSPQGKLKTAIIEKTFVERRVDLVFPGPREFSSGVDFFKAKQFPFLISNQKAKLPELKSEIKFRDIKVYSYLSPMFFNVGTHKSQYLEDLEPFLSGFKNTKGKTKRVLLFRGNLKELKRIQHSSLFDLIIPANPSENEEEQNLLITAGKKEYQLASTKGQNLVLFEFSPKSKTTKTKEFWLSKDISDDTALKPLFQTYDEQVKALFFEEMSSTSLPKKFDFNGAKNCKGCHQKAWEVWKNSRHAHAWQTLKKVNKNFDPECIQCHALGFRKGGFISEKKTPQFINVQCENCHGKLPDNHFEPSFRKTIKKINEVTCKQCHVGSHSPEFDFKTYWPLIRHTK